MRRWFERLILPLVETPVTRPPDTLLAFYRHFLMPVRGTIVIVLLISLVTAVTEMSIFVFLGWLVDRATEGPKVTFFATYWPELLGMALVIVCCCGR
ncbi:MAG: hypothetical protein WDM94_13340 [Bauldia sp.]